MDAASPEAGSLAVPLLDLDAQYAAIGAELEEAVLRVLRSGHYILGPEVEGLEAEVAMYSGCTQGVAVSSGTDALLVCLMAEGVGPGDEVIVPDYSFFATAGVVCRLGATPVFVDIDPATFNIDVSAAACAITDRTKAIIPVHLFGQMAEMDDVLALGREKHLVVIEDAAQAIGAEYRGRRAGSMGHYGCLSFFPSKNLGGIGDGGMVVTNDVSRAEKVRILRTHGAKPKYHHQLVGGNFRLDAIQAAALRVKLRHLDDWTSRRQQNAAWYRQALAAVPGLTLPYEGPSRRHIYNQFVVATAGRERLRSGLGLVGIGSEVYYPVPFHRQRCFAELPSARKDFPVSVAAAERSLAIPIHPEMSIPMLEAVSRRVVDLLRTRG
ncbi:MAG TPA: DegT/DnrJ/EryC1/StrS family aminotransferase [Thermoanaerobaculia bacterium]|nr:DegT/DnrJ/EryC1/StrS family aminotransferase [Thermoanaerobaculia bacterium]